MWREFTARGNYKWIDILEDLIDNCNHTKHRTIKIKPDNVTVGNEKHVLQTIYKPLQSEQARKQNKFKVGDKVRDQPIEERFYAEELSKVKYPDVYLVEKIIKKHGSKMYVKWLGFDNSHNSWINKSDL
ncbi:uncharacterized protein LOC128667351 [Microplitis demolitor]|uniref:uncharacterized protein LOC128667351 n=1 Tax=Microplitis demolitor TaxID=69319 RepID=UPI00235B6A58|nr:uncharacterized protein LOC128667351 [Microplitis demolitor]